MATAKRRTAARLQISLCNGILELVLRSSPLWLHLTMQNRKRPWKAAALKITFWLIWRRAVQTCLAWMPSQIRVWGTRRRRLSDALGCLWRLNAVLSVLADTVQVRTHQKATIAGPAAQSCLTYMRIAAAASATSTTTTFAWTASRFVAVPAFVFSR